MYRERLRPIAPRLFFLLALLLIGAGVFLQATRTEAAAGIRVEMACTPPSNAETFKVNGVRYIVTAGTSQTCTIRVRNTGTALLEGVAVTHNSHTTMLTSSSSTYSAGVTALPGGNYHMPPNSMVLITEQRTFTGPGYGNLTKACASGEDGDVSVSACSNEQTTLP